MTGATLTIGGVKHNLVAVSYRAERPAPRRVLAPGPATFEVEFDLRGDEVREFLRRAGFSTIEETGGDPPRFDAQTSGAHGWTGLLVDEAGAYADDRTREWLRRPGSELVRWDPTAVDVAAVLEVA